jgi:hypothetical protein
VRRKPAERASLDGDVDVGDDSQPEPEPEALRGGKGSLRGPGDSAGRGGFGHGQRADGFTNGHFRDSRSILRAASAPRAAAEDGRLGDRSALARPRPPVRRPAGCANLDIPALAVEPSVCA